MAGKHPGRVGDSPLPGSGLYAGNLSVSFTFIIVMALYKYVYYYYYYYVFHKVCYISLFWSETPLGWICTKFVTAIGEGSPT